MTRLGIGQLAVSLSPSHVGGDFVKVSQLPHGGADHTVLRRPHRASGVKKIHYGRRAAVNHRRSLPDQLGQDDAAQYLGVCHYQGAGQGYREVPPAIAMERISQGRPALAHSIMISVLKSCSSRGLFGQVPMETMGRSRSFSFPPATAAAISIK